MRTVGICLFILMILFTAGCGKHGPADIQGHWRATWESSAGEIPVDMTIVEDEEGDLTVAFHNAEETVTFDRVVREGTSLKMFLDRYECVIEAELSDDGQRMSGRWSKETGGPNSTNFSAEKGDLPRFPIESYPPAELQNPVQDISGEWKFHFDGDEFDEIAYFHQDGEHLTADIRAADGDFRYLEGIYRHGRLCLSCFNGTWVFIFKAVISEEGSFDGIWARGMKPGIGWIASREKPQFPDPWTLSHITSKDGRFRFSFPLAEDPKKEITASDPMLRGKPYILALTMTGCPNANDNAEVLAELYRDYHDQGLNVVCVMSEMRDDLDLIQKRCIRFSKEHDLPAVFAYDISMSKSELGEKIPDLETLYSWPTTLFIGADGKVKEIHTGMDGPATGKFYTQLVGRYRQTVEEMLDDIK